MRNSALGVWRFVCRIAPDVSRGLLQSSETRILTRLHRPASWMGRGSCPARRCKIRGSGATSLLGGSNADVGGFQTDLDGNSWNSGCVFTYKIGKNNTCCPGTSVKCVKGLAQCLPDTTVYRFKDSLFFVFLVSLNLVFVFHDRWHVIAGLTYCIKLRCVEVQRGLGASWESACLVERSQVHMDPGGQPQWPRADGLLGSCPLNLAPSAVRTVAFLPKY